MDIPVLYIVVPCYNEQEVLAETQHRLSALLTLLIERQLISPESKILYVDDGSKDHTWQILSGLAESFGCVSAIKLAANAGHQNALLAGLSVAVNHCDMAITIDADLQDDVNAMTEMVEKFNSGCDIVYGVRNRRDTDSFFKKYTALCFYKLMHGLGVKSVYNHADYRLMSKRAISQLLQYREVNLFLRGIVPLIGYKTDCVYYDRAERFAGESKYPLTKMLNFAVDGITSFSIKPVRLIGVIGIIFLLMAIIISIYVLYRYFTNHTIEGWTTLILSLWFIGGVVLLALSIIGEYIGKIYMEVKQRPRFNIETILL